LFPPVRTAFLGDRDPRGDELLQVPGTDPNGVVDPDVRQIAVLAELVDHPGADAEHLRHYAIIGFGKIGQALAKAFARSGIEVSTATTRDEIEARERRPRT
jgi:hypothetical protein